MTWTDRHYSPALPERYQARTWPDLCKWDWPDTPALLNDRLTGNTVRIFVKHPETGWQRVADLTKPYVHHEMIGKDKTGSTFGRWKDHRGGLWLRFCVIDGGLPRNIKTRAAVMARLRRAADLCERMNAPVAAYTHARHQLHLKSDQLVINRTKYVTRVSLDLGKFVTGYS